ncbi:MAG: hypothetical protein GTO24_21300 [candidate division Zixibacteria bacterium]|nr:hypothetical protein [candidate division Zixibacteria bacterium]
MIGYTTDGRIVEFAFGTHFHAVAFKRVEFRTDEAYQFLETYNRPFEHATYWIRNSLLPHMIEGGTIEIRLAPEKLSLGTMPDYLFQDNKLKPVEPES